MAFLCTWRCSSRRRLSSPAVAFLVCISAVQCLLNLASALTGAAVPRHGLLMTTVDVSRMCVCGSTVCTPPLSCSLQATANDDDAPPPVPSCCMYCPHALPITDAQLRASSATVPRCLWNDVRGSCSPLQLLYLALEPPTPTTLWHKCVRLVWRSVACQYISRSSACRRISPHHSSHSNTMACRRKCAHMVATKPPLCTVTLSVCCMG